MIVCLRVCLSVCLMFCTLVCPEQPACREAAFPDTMGAPRGVKPQKRLRGGKKSKWPTGGRSVAAAQRRLCGAGRPMLRCRVPTFARKNARAKEPTAIAWPAGSITGMHEFARVLRVVFLRHVAFCSAMDVRPPSRSVTRAVLYAAGVVYFLQPTFFKISSGDIPNNPTPSQNPRGTPSLPVSLRMPPCNFIKQG